jgi:5'-3' exoribonuclease 1
MEIYIFSCELIDKNKFQLPMESIYYGLLPGVKLDIYFPGFPTMKHLPHTVSEIMAKIV